MPVLGIGDDELAFDLGDVAGERLTATGGVDTAQHITAQRRGGQCGQHLRGVAEQHTDVQRTVRIRRADQCGGLRAGVGYMLAPCPRAVAVLHRDGVLLGALTKELLECVRHGHLSTVNRFLIVSTMSECREYAARRKRQKGDR